MSAKKEQIYLDLLCDVADSGVAFQDPRVKYVEVQIDRGTWEQIRALRAEKP